ncbi:MAG: hypothetical protein CL678_13085 [Bdellovibrionaceae bacterium]|nr:hypothetical protein [Pseudobdellovibrionaceae bacterium]|tara:strand:- start:242 stop:1522 length:1281 start_codon:yes stop_codon:yes gene_type:complete
MLKGSVSSFFLTLLFFSTKVLCAPVSLKELVSHGLKNTPSYQSSLNNLKISENETRNALFSFFPSLDLTSEQGFASGTPFKNENLWSGTLSLSLSANLYNNGTNVIEYKRSHLIQKRRKIAQQKIRAELTLSIILQYFDISLFDEIQLIQDRQYQLLKKQFHTVEALYKQGRKKRIDYIRFKARVQRANLGFQNAQLKKEQAIEDLKKIIAWKEKKLIIQKQPIEFSSFKTKSGKVLFDNHYDSRISSLQKEINEFEVDLEKRQYWPRVFLNTGVDYINSNYLDGLSSFSDNRQFNWSAILSIDFNLWDFGIRRRNIETVRLEQMNLNNQIDTQLLDLKATINKNLLSIKQQKENFKLSQELLHIEKTNFESIQRDYRNGKTTFLDLINSLDNYTNAQESFYTNYYRLKKSLSQYKFHQGTLYEDL